MLPITLLALPLMALLASPVNAAYSLTKSYEGSSFFDGWSFYGEGRIAEVEEGGSELTSCIVVRAGSYDNLTNGGECVLFLLSSSFESADERAGSPSISTIYLPSLMTYSPIIRVEPNPRAKNNPHLPPCCHSQTRSLSTLPRPISRTSTRPGMPSSRSTTPPSCHTTRSARRSASPRAIPCVCPFLSREVFPET
jgi:hypothetical protein